MHHAADAEENEESPACCGRGCVWVQVEICLAARRELVRNVHDGGGRTSELNAEGFDRLLYKK
jgi:hypothetical protein